MRLSITGRKARLTDRLRTHIERRVRFALSRFGTRVASVRVRLGDATAARGRGERSCEVTVTVRGTEPVHSRHLDRRTVDAVDHALARVSRDVARTVERLDGSLAVSREPRTSARARRGE